MASSTFYQTVIGGVSFQGLMSGDGPAIALASGRSAPLGRATSIRFVSDEREVAEMIPASARTLEVETLREVGEKSWWVVKYLTEPKIDLSGLSDADRRQLAREFGIAIGDDYEDQREALFFGSPAFRGLLRWVHEHPKQARKCSTRDGYLNGWYERALQGWRA